MNAPTALAEHYELRFDSLFDAGRGYSFICSADGLVDLDGLSRRSRANYFYARMMVGHAFTLPRIVRVVALVAGDAP